MNAQTIINIYNEARFFIQTRQLSTSWMFKDVIKFQEPSMVPRDGVLPDNQLVVSVDRAVGRTARVQFIESKTLISNRENSKIYYINLDVFSIGIQYFAFNEQSPVH